MDENNVNNQEGHVYVVGSRGYSAYEVAVQQGFEGTVDEWLASLQGEQGPEGPEGPQGNPGPTGLTPSIRVGSVTTGEPNTNVEISITGTPEVPIVNFKIPKGDKGDKGDPGSADLNNYYTKSEVDNLIPTVPTNVSAFTNDAGYLTQHQDISGKLDTSKVKNTNSTTAGDVYDVIYINTMIGDIESLLGGI